MDNLSPVGDHANGMAPFWSNHCPTVRDPEVMYALPTIRQFHPIRSAAVLPDKKNKVVQTRGRPAELAAML
jgi:hypothetical protein